MDNNIPKKPAYENIVHLNAEANEKLLKKLAKQPIIETRAGLSKDRKWLIHTTIITDIKKIEYYEKILGKETN